MAYRAIEQVPEDAPEIEQILEAVLLQALDIAREKLEQEKLLVPFTALAVGETLFIETHPAEDSEDCFKMAQHTVQNARGALAYAFCYDGYVDTDDGELDAIIAEGGIPGAEAGHAVGYLYKVEGEGEELEFKVEDHPLYIGQAPNFMEFTLVVIDDEELDEDLDEEDEDAEDVDEDADEGDDEDEEDEDDEVDDDNEEGSDN